ncbi:MAG TPA: hypothetical protein VJZ17_05655 [Nitrosopumilaceae archaeon]|nr:hypothetical protein [Nitrosopumilaceae archaeon]
MKNVLIDQNCPHLIKEEYKELLKDYDSKYLVGKDMKQTSFDENCAYFCLERNCDFLTADKESYDHFFKIKSIKLIQVSRFLWEDNAKRWIYRMQIVDGKKNDLSKGVKL